MTLHKSVIGFIYTQSEMFCFSFGEYIVFHEAQHKSENSCLSVCSYTLTRRILYTQHTYVCVQCNVSARVLVVNVYVERKRKNNEHTSKQKKTAEIETNRKTENSNSNSNDS